MITREEMQAIDTSAMKQLEIPGIILMENASISFVQYLPQDEDNYLIIAGMGNNGGDGLAIARHLAVTNKKVSIIIVGDLLKSKHDFFVNFKIIKAMKLNLDFYDDILKLEKEIEKSDIIIDSLLGTGLKGQVKEPFFTIIDAINNSGKKVYSVDIPSGLDTNNGIPLGICVKADMTVTMHAMKIGLHTGKEYTGDVKIANIGIPFDYKPK